MNDIEMYRNPTQWNKVNREHMRNIGKVFKVKSPNWEPAINYIGKIGRSLMLTYPQVVQELNL